MQTNDLSQEEFQRVAHEVSKRHMIAMHRELKEKLGTDIWMMVWTWREHNLSYTSSPGVERWMVMNVMLSLFAEWVKEKPAVERSRMT